MNTHKQRYMAAYRVANRKKIALMQARYRKANRVALSRAKKRYYAVHRARISARRKAACRLAALVRGHRRAILEALRRHSINRRQLIEIRALFKLI